MIRGRRICLRCITTPGQFYVSTVGGFERNGSLWGDNTAPIVLSELEVQDLDTDTDWALAEMKYRMLHESGRQS